MRLIKSIRNRGFSLLEELFDRISFLNINLKSHKDIISAQKKYGFLKIYPDKNSLWKYCNLLLEEIETPFVKLDSNIVTIGTCFAEQILNHFPHNTRIYEKKKTNSFGFAADWGRITSLYHLANLTKMYKSKQTNFVTLNLAEFPLSLKQKILYNFKNKFINESSDYQDNYYLDNSREHLFIYEDKLLLEKDLNSHIFYANEAISKSTDIIITLGQLGHFIDNDNNLYPIKPSSRICKLKNIKFIDIDSLNLFEYIDLLEKSIDNIRNISPLSKLYISLSPVPAHAYFGKKDIMTAHWYAKSMLYQVIHEVVKSDSKLTYIPTFDIVKSTNLTSLRRDLRHLKPWFRKKIFSNFS